MDELREYLLASLSEDLISWSAQVAAAERFGLDLGRVEDAILDLGLLPARYQRNRRTISIVDQRELRCSRVAVIGCGGLGGYVIEELARLGVGEIVAIDPDIFEEHNLNRQLLSTPANLGQAKVEAAAARVAEINPAVRVTPVREALSPENGAALLAGSRVVVDALDSIPMRLQLAEVCAALAVPLVHGAIGGWYGQVATQFPGDATLQRLYRTWGEGKGIEQGLGNPAFTPAVVASIQVAEACKVILGQGECVRNRVLFINLLQMQVGEMVLKAAEKT